MRVNYLNINNLRNIDNTELTPHPQLNILHGNNGSGKTSVLEAMVVLAKGRSFRSGNVGALVGANGDSFRVMARLESTGKEEHRVGLQRNANEWQGRIDGENLKQLSDLAPLLPLVLLEPNSHTLISGSPEGRRRFLDWGVFHVKHGYLDTWRRYSRVVKQRNAALRTRNRQVVASLEPQLVKLGTSLDQHRKDYAEELMKKASIMSRRLSPGLKPVNLQYERGWRGGDYSEALGKVLERDLERGSTGVGPHRADVSIKLGNNPAREQLSRGEQKILAASLLLAQAETMDQAGSKPALLFDDLSSEFDQDHLANVIKLGSDMDTQVWVTGTSVEPYLEMGLGEHLMFHVKHGVIKIS